LSKYPKFKKNENRTNIYHCLARCIILKAMVVAIILLREVQSYIDKAQKTMQNKITFWNSFSCRFCKRTCYLSRSTNAPIIFLVQMQIHPSIYISAKMVSLYFGKIANKVLHTLTYYGKYVLYLLQDENGKVMFF
jgi:hypothetical protein